MASLVPDNPYDVTQQKQFAGTGDVTGYITGGQKKGDNWEFIDQQGKVLTSVPYQDFVNNYQTDSGVVRGGVTSINGVPVYNFNNSGGGSGQQASASRVPQQNELTPPTGVNSVPQTLPSNGVNPYIASGKPTASGFSIADPYPVNPDAGGNPQVTTPGLIQSSLPKEAVTYTPETREVNKATDTVQGQVDSILSKDSPLMQRARTLAKQGMAQRGLVNSSMAQGAGTAAMIDRATPIAAQDANIYNSVANANMDARNRASEFNSTAKNQFGLQGNDQSFQADQLKRQQDFTTSERLGSQSFTAQLENARQNFSAAQAQLDRAQQMAMADKSLESQKFLQESQQKFSAAQAELDRTQQTAMQSSQQAFQTSLTQLQQSFTAAQNALDRAQQAYMQDDAQEFQRLLNNSNIPANFAMQISQSTMQSINTIAADPNLSAASDGYIDPATGGFVKTDRIPGPGYIKDGKFIVGTPPAGYTAVSPSPSSPKARAIQSTINYSNSQLQWAAKFYNTTIPNMPGSSSPNTAPPPPN